MSTDWGVTRSTSHKFAYWNVAGHALATPSPGFQLLAGLLDEGGQIVDGVDFRAFASIQGRKVFLGSGPEPGQFGLVFRFPLLKETRTTSLASLKRPESMCVSMKESKCSVRTTLRVGMNHSLSLNGLTVGGGGAFQRWDFAFDGLD
jgi:hypothetical protein